jgi:hypothetical protein
MKYALVSGDTVTVTLGEDYKVDLRYHELAGGPHILIEAYVRVPTDTPFTWEWEPVSHAVQKTQTPPE